MGFPGSSAGKKPACNVGDLGPIPGLRKFPGEGTGYPLQYSWASLMAQTVKNLPAGWETWVRSWVKKEGPEGGHGNSLQYSCLANHNGQRCLAGYSPWCCKEPDTTERQSTSVQYMLTTNYWL